MNRLSWWYFGFYCFLEENLVIKVDVKLWAALGFVYDLFFFEREKSLYQQFTFRKIIKKQWMNLVESREIGIFKTSHQFTSTWWYIFFSYLKNVYPYLIQADHTRVLFVVCVYFFQDEKNILSGDCVLKSLIYIFFNLCLTYQHYMNAVYNFLNQLLKTLSAENTLAVYTTRIPWLRQQETSVFWVL